MSDFIVFIFIGLVIIYIVGCVFDYLLDKGKIKGVKRYRAEKKYSAKDDSMIYDDTVLKPLFMSDKEYNERVEKGFKEYHKLEESVKRKSD